jgi:hypothetical protein
MFRLVSSIPAAGFAIACASLSACSGSGEGLDQNGRPIDTTPPPVSAFKTIQDTIFTPLCVTCHAGPAAPRGLRLESGVAFAALVNAPSAEVPALLRVKPGDPNASYLVQKIEGRAAVGARMPLGQPPLSQANIDLIRQWITDGAPPIAAVSLPSIVTLKAVTPVEEALLSEAPDAIVVTADAELDTSLLTPANVVVMRSGGDKSFAEGNEVVIPGITIVIRSLEPTVFAISLPSGQWIPEQYLLTVNGSGPAPVADRRAISIDGDGNGIAGGDFEFSFAIESKAGVNP